MFGIPVLTLLKIAAVVILAAILAGMVYAAYQHVVDKGRAEIRTKYAPLIVKCDEQKRPAAECAQQWTDAVAFNVSLQKDVEKNAAETAECNLKVERLKGQSASMQARGERATADAAPKINTLKGQVASLEAALRDLRATKKPEVSCAKAIAKAGAVVLDVATERLRDFPAAAATGGKGGAPATPTNPGPGPVRQTGPSTDAPAK